MFYIITIPLILLKLKRETEIALLLVPMCIEYKKKIDNPSINM